MTAIRAIFDGRAFVPQQPVSVAPQSEALVLVNSTDQTAQQSLDDAVRKYYESAEDAEDQSWGRAAAADSQRAWDED